MNELVIIKLKWYWNRLNRMSVAEMTHRMRCSAHSAVQKIGFLNATSPPDPEFSLGALTGQSVQVDINARHYVDAADRILHGRLAIFSMDQADIGHPPNWNRDPKTNTVAPLLFGKTLDYRNESLVGDIKYLWEPNRHLQLVTMAQAYSLTKNKTYLDGLSAQLNSWFEQCPYPLGPNWTSSLELGIRLINWAFVWRLVGGADSPLFDGRDGANLRKRWLASIYQHAHFIKGHFSRHSSANNHLIGEAAGLFVAAVTWPCWDEMAKWRCDAKNILEREILLQTMADGVNREQAVSYQQFVLDFCIVSGLAARVAAIEFSDGYWKQIESMLEYLASIMDVAGNIPMIGDADDGYVVRLSQDKDFCPYRSLLATGAILFARPDFKQKAGSLDDKTRWLLDDADAQYEAIVGEAGILPVRHAFPEGGYYILGGDFETAVEVRLVVDSGPLGYLSIAAHGHADALSFTLSLGGSEFLVDPGTYSYHTQKKWRDYFRGTSAHNTIRIDGEDQSLSGGNFMWVRHANAICETWEPGEDGDRFVGSHDGYLRLSDPVLHRREIQLNKPKGVIRVTDTLHCEGKHQIERFWHFSEDCDVSLGESSIVAEKAGKRLELRCIGADNMNAVLLRGEESPPAGWVSRRFDEKLPSSTVAWRSEIQGATQLVTEIAWHFG